MGISGGPDIVQDGLVLELDAADRNSYPGSGTTWRDLSGNANNGTLINGPTFNSGNGGSIVFDGTNDYAQTTNINLSSTNTVSVEVWCKLNSYPQVVNGGQILFEFSTNFNSVTDGFVVSYAEDSNPAFGGGFPIAVLLKGNIGYNASYWPKTLVNDLLWHQWMCVFDKGATGAETFLYIDGVSRVGTFTTLNSNNTNNFGTQPLFLAGRGTIANSNNQQSIIRIYNRTLSSTEILQNYNATKTRFGL